ncbi:MAG: MetS family NSS transporter small subunit [Bacteroidota bacterium]
MSGSVILSMILILGLVVGGFIFFLLKAIKREKEKR